jgi:hypothetical protein
MTDDLQGLSPIMRRAYDALISKQDKEEFLAQTKSLHSGSIRNGIAAIMARNLSHGVGTHICNLKGNK